MGVSLKGAIFMLAREAVVLTAYQDGEHLSIGAGDNDPNLKPGDTITVEEAFVRFARAIKSREAIVDKALAKAGIVLPQHQYDALFSGYYQSGTDLLTDVIQAIGTGDYKAISVAFLKHDTNKKGEHKHGLHKRRLREATLFETEDYGDLSSIPFYTGNPWQGAKQERYVVDPGDLTWLQ
jgi:GH24 family phage-related lysozyme (muramidase)